MKQKDLKKKIYPDGHYIYFKYVAKAELEELYEDKVNQVIRKEDFERMYNQTTEDKKETIQKIKNIEVEIKQIEEKLNDVDMEKIEKRAKEILSLDT